MDQLIQLSKHNVRTQQKLQNVCKNITFVMERVHHAQLKIIIR